MWAKRLPQKWTSISYSTCTLYHTHKYREYSFHWAITFASHLHQSINSLLLLSVQSQQRYYSVYILTSFYEPIPWILFSVVFLARIYTTPPTSLQSILNSHITHSYVLASPPDIKGMWRWREVGAGWIRIGGWRVQKNQYTITLCHLRTRRPIYFTTNNTSKSSLV